MDEDQIEPSDVERMPDIIRRAKYEIGKTDVLICGQCHTAFYHIEEFQQHRSEDKCPQVSILRENEKLEPKEQIWGFMLWKNGIINMSKKNDLLTTWTLYKRWCALNESDKEAWVIAGQNLQTFSKLTLSGMHEIKSRAAPPITKKSKPNSVLMPEKSNTSFAQYNDTLEEGEVRLSQLTDSQRAAIKAQIAANKTNKENAASSEIKKVPTKLALLYSELIKKPPELRRALRTGKNSIIEEAVFEKVLSRRFNHKSKCLEYFVKWENMKETENTWEPKIHFEKCKQIMDEFDKVFNTSKIIPKPSSNQSMDSPIKSESEEMPMSRPPRSSKQKAKDQVKSWCDSMSDDEELGKRKLFDEDSDSSDSFEKKIKLEEETDSSEDERSNRKTKGFSMSVNGLSKKSVDNIAPQRIVRVSQKHLPNLSTGVYIMSKTEGIIKLNSDTPIPSSSPLLKVGHKIGQTHIKVIKKDVQKSPVKIQPKITKEVSMTKITPMVQDIPGTPEKSIPEEESDDGLSELEFPTDLPLPEPDSPPGDFVLDPLTGKIAGQVYEDSSKESDDEMLPAGASENEHEATSLDSLVKLAVSELPDLDDITDDKLALASKLESIASSELQLVSESPPSIILDTSIKIKTEPTSVLKTCIQPLPSTSKNLLPMSIDLESAITLTTIEKTPTIIKSESSTSILNAALTNTRMPQKKLLSTTPSTIRQKVIPRQQMRMPSPSTTIIHKVSNRPKPFPPRAHLQDPIVKRGSNVATYKPASSVTRRIGSTTIYKTNPKPQQISRPISKPPSTFRQPSIISRMNSPLGPINMPLIGIDDEPETIAHASTPVIEPPETDLLSNDLPTINLADADAPLFITSEDGTVYQVAGQNEDGQTILISEGPDGQQQCVVISAESTVEDEMAQPMLIAATPETHEQPSELEDTKMEIEEPEGENDECDDSQVVAQIVKADPPSPGGTRKVVLMLPGGELMMTDVTAEQYAALELDK